LSSANAALQALHVTAAGLVRRFATAESLSTQGCCLLPRQQSDDDDNNNKPNNNTPSVTHRGMCVALLWCSLLVRAI